MFHFSCLSRKATNGLLLNVVRLCLNLTEHMLGGIKAILFLKQCSTQLSLSYNPIPASATEPNTSLKSRRRCVFQGYPRSNWESQPVNVPVSDLDGTCSSKTNSVPSQRGFGGRVLCSWWDSGVKMTISQSSKSQTQLSYLELLGRAARFNGGGSLSEL